MNRVGRLVIVGSLVVALFAMPRGPSIAEDIKLGRAIPFGILSRVFPIRIGKDEGTCFVIDIDQRQYIITARHLAKGMGERAGIQLFINEQWLTLQAKPIWPSTASTDIVALAANRIIAPRMEIAIGSGSIFAGQDVYFLGYPFGLATQFDKPSPARFPFIKKAILSAIDSRSGSGNLLYLDGVNNPGFSGGPVIFANYSSGDRLQIAGVISGYRNNPIEVRSVEIPESNAKSATTPGTRTVSYVLENTGIVVAYSISEIENAIRADPIGPQLPKEN